ncbi:MAG TPA: Rossmann-like and DUF2520 domain-containing protein [bacterium]|jgi:predicted short-subunit dehydrogenase-like oxidoreductase (DUF2520 family)
MPLYATSMATGPITIIGLGAVGSGLSRALCAAGCRQLTLVSRGRAGEQRLSKALKVRHLRKTKQLQQEHGVIILAVKEGQLALLAEELARLPLPWPKLAVLHTAGSIGAEVLQPLASLGAGIAAWHPYQTFPRRAQTVTLAGVTFGTDGNRKGILAANKLTRLLGGKPLKVSGEDRVLYHLSAVLACGFVAADLHMAVDVLKRTGVPEARALQAVLPIARETLSQVAALGPAAAQTGPAVRGDKATIQKHLRALRDTDPELMKVYKAVIDYIIASQTHRTR